MVTEGNGHVIDPDGEARRALHEAVAQHGPEALSNEVVMDGLCRDRLSGLPGEVILIGSAARADVPAQLRDLIPRLGNYGAIQSVATALADAQGLDPVACVWVVREFARALGLIASGGTQPMSTAGGDTGPATAAGAGTGPVGSAAGGPEAPEGLGAPGQPDGLGGPGAQGGPGGPGGPGAQGGPLPGPPAGGPPAAGPLPGGPPAGRPTSGGRVLNRNTVGVAAAIALVAGYLGIAAVAHLSPFPSKEAPAASSPPAGPPGSTSASPQGSPDPSPDPDPSPTSDYQILLTKIPSTIQGMDNCRNAGTSVGATAVSQCSGLQGMAAGTIIYYLFPDQATLGTGFSSFLSSAKFTRRSGCTTNSKFVNFVPECESGFTSQSPAITGSIAEYANTDNNPIIVTSDNHQRVMVVMVGTNDGDLLSYWKQLQWVVT